MVALLGKEPSLLGVSPPRIAMKVEVLASLLGWRTTQAARCLTMQPRLLRLSPRTLTNRLEDLRQALVELSIGEGAIGEERRHKDPLRGDTIPQATPEVLTGLNALVPPPQMADRGAPRHRPLPATGPRQMPAEEDILTGQSGYLLTGQQGQHVPKARLDSRVLLVRVMSRHPGVLMLPSSVLQMHLKGMQLHFDSTDEGVVNQVITQPSLLFLKPDTLHEKVDQLAAMLGIDWDRANRLAARFPGVLTQAIDTLEEKMRELSVLLGISWEDTSRLILRQPTILTRTSACVIHKVDQLKSLLGWDHPTVTRVVCCYPQLLTMDPEALRGKMERLGVLAGARPEWRDQLSKSAPKSVALYLTFSLQRYERLAAVEDMGIKMSLSKILVMTEADWKLTSQSSIALEKY